MKKQFFVLMMLFMLVTMLSSSHAYARDPDISEYDAALASITEGNYYLVTNVDGVKYYVTLEGGLTDDKEYGGTFTISKTSGGGLYDIGILIEPGTGNHFSNTTLIDGKANLHPGSFCLNTTHNRNDWERQVFFLNTNGKYAIRTSNTPFGTSSYYDAGRTFWTYEVNEANIPTPCYSYDPAYIWILESAMMDGNIIINGISYIIDNDRMVAKVTFWPNYNKYSGNVVIPSSISYNGNIYTVTSIGNSAFRDCTGLTSVTIPESIKSIGGSAFYGCSGMEKVIVADLAAWCKISFAGYDSNPLSQAHHLYSDKYTEITNLIIPNGVTNIGNYAFRTCTSLTSVTIPNSVTSIGDCVFDGCSGLTSITIPNSVTIIGYGAIWGCSGLTSITIPNSVTDIGGKAFERCSGLTSITIPKSVKNIGDCAFRYCNNLTKVVVPDIAAWCSISFDGYYANPLKYAHHIFSDERTEITDLVIPSGVTSIGIHAFRECFSLTSVTIPESVTIISDCAFDTCRGLTSVTIPDCVKSIGYATFWGCSGLTNITIGSGMTSIGEIAFQGCSSLTDVYCFAEEAPETNINAFDSPQISSATLHVPESSIDSYKTTSPWKGFGNIQSLTYTLTYVVDGEIYKTYEVDFGTTITPEEEPMKEGYTFNGWSGIPETMPAGDVVVTGTFTVNSYILTYIVDGEEYKTSSVNYGTALTPEEEPTKEGYTFSGWSEIPETMPAEDVTVTGSFTINQYLLTYIIDGEEYKSYAVDFNTAIIPEPAPVRKGMTFSGWGDVPETMPAYDLTLSGTYSWSKEIVDGVIYQVTDTLSNYASVVGTEDIPGEVTILTDMEIGGDMYTVNNVEKDALPQSVTINISFGKLLLCLWNNGYEDIRETGTGRSLAAPEISLVAATASSLTLSYKNDYPELTETVIVSGSPITKGKNGYEVALKGLEPDYLYEGLASLTLTLDEASYTKSFSFRTEPLTLATQQPKIVSLGNVVVAANSNLDDEEKNVGFEWRRTDWTEDFASNFGTAYLYEGTMEGYIRNLNADKLWKYRPYYTSNTGNRHYGDWVGIDPTNISYFVPTVHTYSMINLIDNLAEIWGYVMRGTDNITSQGFMYWSTGSASSRRNANGIPSDAKTILASGNVMTATLENLDYDTEYCYLAFVTTSEGETFYGEPQTFRTGEGDPDGIKDIDNSPLNIDHSWYDLSGRKIDKPQKGINIIRYSDGTSKKVLVK